MVTDPEIYFAGADNFTELLGSTDFWGAARVTLAYLVLSTALHAGARPRPGAGACRRPRSAGMLRALVVMPLIIPPVVAGFTWRFLLNAEIGFIGAFLLPMAGVQRAACSPIRIGALVSVVIADVWSRTPFMFLIFLAALQGIPQDYYEAARLDGAGRSAGVLPRDAAADQGRDGAWRCSSGSSTRSTPSS